eukprot:SM000153S01584  [mRNA]  locus=s153:59860:61411:+ [translate_table: standard]
MQAVYEKGSAEEVEDFLFALVDLLGDGPISRYEAVSMECRAIGELALKQQGDAEKLAWCALALKGVGREEAESVVLSTLETVLGPAEATPDSSVQAILDAAAWSRDDTAKDTLTKEGFQAWCRCVPSLPRFLGSLMTSGGAALASRRVPLLAAAADCQSHILLRREHAWHIAGALPEASARDSVPRPTILVVRDKGGALFGGYASQPWERRSTFYGDLKSFLFTLTPAMRLHKASGANTNILWCASGFTSDSVPNGVGLGGQPHHFGIFLDSTLERAHSRPCVTFGSPPLSSTPEFVPDVIECWAVLPADGLEADDAVKGTILERFKEDRAVLNMVGIANASDS